MLTAHAFPSLPPRRAAIFLALAVLVHLLFLWALAHFPLRTSAPARVAVENWDASQLEALKKNWADSKPLLLGKDTPASEEAPKNARYESDRNRSVPRETRAERADVLPRPGGAGSNAQRSEAASEPDLSRLGVGLSRPRPPREQASPGARGADQALPDRSLPLGAENVLNTQESKYYSFYSRLYQIIAPNWQSEIRRASTFKRVSPGTYVTTADVVLDSDGNLIEVRVIDTSGVPEFDEAVHRAWQRIGRFPNPPKDLLDEHGRAHTGWTFYVNVDSGFNLQYVPPERNY